MAELREWLEARGLGRYADALLAQDIELDILPQLTDADLTAAALPQPRPRSQFPRAEPRAPGPGKKPLATNQSRRAGIVARPVWTP